MSSWAAKGWLNADAYTRALQVVDARRERHTAFTRNAWLQQLRSSVERDLPRSARLFLLDAVEADRIVRATQFIGSQNRSAVDKWLKPAPQSIH